MAVPSRSYCSPPAGHDSIQDTKISFLGYCPCAAVAKHEIRNAWMRAAEAVIAALSLIHIALLTKAFSPTQLHGVIVVAIERMPAFGNVSPHLTRSYGMACAVGYVLQRGFSFKS